MMRVVKNYNGNYTSGDSPWSRSRSFDSGNSYKMPRKKVMFDR